MKKLLTIALLAFLSLLPASAKYTIHSIKGNVKVERAGQMIPATKGMEVMPTDNLHIAKEAKVEILNSVNSKIFSSIRPGEISVTRFIIDAQIKSDDNAANVADNIRLTNLGNGRKRNPRWLQKGAVKRSIARFDPAAKALRTDPAILAKWFVNAVSQGPDTTAVFPVKVIHAATPDGGLEFLLENTQPCPVYFNILKIQGDTISTIDISELGQPMGSYAVLPGQSISRKQFSGIDPASRHILILAPYYFDIDELISKISDAAKGNDNDSFAADEKPAFLLWL